MSLSRDDILNAKDVEIREVNVPEWGGTVLVKSLSGKDRDAFEDSMRVITRDGEAMPDFTNSRAKLVARTICDADGGRIFTDADVTALGQKSALALNRVYEIAAELSGLGDDAEDEAVGNSGAVPSDGSTSTSPETLDAPSENY